MTKEKLIDLSGLNFAQSEAVKSIDGASLIIAGAGSGKTRVLIYKIAYLLEKGFSPSSVMALTFTNHAAKEMKARIADLVGRDKSVRLWMGTFHSIFLRFLRENAELIGFPSSFTIYDSSDTRNALRACVKELELDDKIYKASDVQSRISFAKNNLVTADAYMNNPTAIQNDMMAKKGRICDIYKLYSKKCIAASVMDFDDILLYMNILLRDHPQVAERLSGQFKYILVDEYQDTNYAQYLIVKKISAVHKNISVVGDDSQSIYGFRGARIQNILNFRKDFPDVREYRLEQNYRSTQTIVNAANSVIDRNSNRIKKKCFSEGAVGEKIEVIKAHTEQDEATLVTSSILNRIHLEKVDYSDFAILYRTNAQSRIIEEMLRRKNLPYKIYAGHSFYERAEVKNMLAYFKLLVNKRDDEAFKRVINFPARGIGGTSLGYLADAAKANNCSLWEAISLENVEEYGLKSAALIKMKSFVSLVKGFESRLEVANAYDIANGIANASGIISFFTNDPSVESVSRLENVEELLNSIKAFVEDRRKVESELGVEDAFISMQTFIENVALLTDLDISTDEKEENNKISLMTVHASKGLEMPYVYIIGMEENLFPSITSLTSQENVEEERRLFYVALTRAATAVSISFSSSRFRWGSHVSYPPSRFVKEIAPIYLSTPIREDLELGSNNDSFAPIGGYRSFPKRDAFPKREVGVQNSSSSIKIPQKPIMSRPIKQADPNFVPDAISRMEVGVRVEHDRFGYGKIVSIEGSEPNIKAIVDFEVGGNKVLLLKYAKLRVVS